MKTQSRMKKHYLSLKAEGRDNVTSLTATSAVLALVGMLLVWLRECIGRGVFKF